MSSMNSLLNAVVIALVVCVLGYSFLGPREAPPPPNDAAFNAAIQQPGLVLVKFGAEWCPPCRFVDGELNRLTAAGKPAVHVVKINVDQNQSLAAHYRVSSIPRLILFRDGKQVDDRTGGMGLEQLQAWLSGYARSSQQVQ